MNSSASDSRKEIACTSNFSKLSKKKTEENDYHSCKHFITFLFYNFSQVYKFKGKSNSKYANALYTVMGLVVVAIIQKNE